ncbi:MAG TPA: alpha/beta hydrolase [Solirubrobacterales bacterium]|jgi:pimeloyl-ACP methyl ester carboxylesterase|nr:alpha/beta hydrolase [Solirubrobacterales bacterium]
MRRGWKILIGVVLVVAVLLAVNAITVDHETKAAGVTEPGGKILDLSGGKLEVVEQGPRTGSPIVLIHCFSCAINWWSRMMPMLERNHRVIAVDLLGHGGSEKPTSGYTIPNQADLVAQALARLGVRDAVVAGHSLGGSVAVGLAERSPQLVRKVMIIDTPPDHSSSSLGLIAKLGFAPVIGEFFWRVKPDFAVKKGLEVAFAPGFDVPDEFVEDVNRMTYSSYHDSPQGSDDYTKEEPLDQRMKESGKPLLVIMGAEEQIVDEPAKRLAEYRQTYPGTETKLIAGSGHSPNVEKPAETAALLLGFANSPLKGVGSKVRGGVGSANGTQRQRQQPQSQGQAGNGAGATSNSRSSGGH